MLEMTPTPFAGITEALHQVGIRMELPSGQQANADCVEYICRPGWVSFALSLHQQLDKNRLVVTFYADLSRWRWWNFPLLWLVSIPFTPWEIELQRDAYKVMRDLGARRIGGGDILLLEEIENSASQGT
jgi:hypothetical protein